MVNHQPGNSAENCLILRADASVATGTGHVMRCLALAEAWTELNGRVIFVMAEGLPPIERRLRNAGMQILHLTAQRGSLADAAETASLARSQNTHAIVIDGYDFADGFQNALSKEGMSVLCIDDDGRYGRYDADFVLNQNVHARESLYVDRSPSTRLLLGTRHALLRSEFSQFVHLVRVAPERAYHILITLGGTDEKNVTGLVVEALASLQNEDFDATVLVGGSNPNFEVLENAARSSQARIRIVRDAKNIPELMAKADLAICAAGSTTLELALMGVPMLLLVIAGNQLALADQMHTLGAAKNLGWATDCSTQEISDALLHSISSREERARLSAAARLLVDGRGAIRVAIALRDSLFAHA